MVTEALKGEVMMKFGDQFARISRKSKEEGVTLRGAIYDIAKRAIENINSLPEKDRREVLEAFINEEPIKIGSVQKTHIICEKSWVEEEFGSFRIELEVIARSLGYIQRSKTETKSTSVFSKEDVFVHLLKYGLSLYK
jgi:6-phosphofructokinase